MAHFTKVKEQLVNVFEDYEKMCKRVKSKRLEYIQSEREELVSFFDVIAVQMRKLFIN